MAKEKNTIASSGNTSATSAGRGRPKAPEPTVTMSIRITEERKKKLKVYAAMHGITISEMIAEYADGLEY